MSRARILADYVSSGDELADKAPLASPAFTGTPTGIVEGSIADNAVTLDKMASGVDGKVITYDASGDPTLVGPGADGEVLTSTGAGSPPAFEAAGGGLDGVTTGSGSVTITDGDLIFGTSGKGICLGVTSNTDANTLDDYEEGTYTFVLTAESGTVQINTGQDTGYYTKIGRVVTVQGQFYIASVIDPLYSFFISAPFTSASLAETGAYSIGACKTHNADWAGGTSPYVEMWGNSKTTIRTAVSGDNIGGNVFLPAGGDYIAFNLTYITA